MDATQRLDQVLLHEETLSEALEAKLIQVVVDKATEFLDEQRLPSTAFDKGRRAFHESIRDTVTLNGFPSIDVVTDQAWTEAKNRRFGKNTAIKQEGVRAARDYWRTYLQGALDALQL